MWKKPETDSESPSEVSDKPISAMQQLKERATIGHTISVKGNLSGDEDLVIYGSVEGKIDMPNNNVTVGEKGRIKADVNSKIISVEGSVRGNLVGQEKVVVRKSGSVHGNIAAPRVTLEDGCKFTGNIDMEGARKGVASTSESSVTVKKPVQPETLNLKSDSKAAALRN